MDLHDRDPFNQCGVLHAFYTRDAKAAFAHVRSRASLPRWTPRGPSHGADAEPPAAYPARKPRPGHEHAQRQPMKLLPGAAPSSIVPGAPVGLHGKFGVGQPAAAAKAKSPVPTVLDCWCVPGCNRLTFVFFPELQGTPAAGPTRAHDTRTAAQRPRPRPRRSPSGLKVRALTAHPAPGPRSPGIARARGKAASWVEFLFPWKSCGSCYTPETLSAAASIGCIVPGDAAENGQSRAGLSFDSLNGNNVLLN